MTKNLLRSLFGAIALSTTVSLSIIAQPVLADETITDTAVAYEVDGKHFTEADVPTFSIAEDGTVDWYTFSGFRRYHAECHVCHGPDGLGSTYAPALTDSVMQISYFDFLEAVVAGRTVETAAGPSVMPAFVDNRNVMCYIIDIYIYLRARGTGELARGRPASRERPSQAFREAENDCMG